MDVDILEAVEHTNAILTEYSQWTVGLMGASLAVIIVLGVFLIIKRI